MGLKRHRHRGRLGREVRFRWTLVGLKRRGERRVRGRPRRFRWTLVGLKLLAWVVTPGFGPFQMDPRGIEAVM